MSAIVHRPICDLLGCTFPIVLAGMGGVARSELVAAVTNAGGFGFLGMVREPIELLRSEVTRLRDCGIERFGVNLIPAATPPALLTRQIRTCIELRVPVLALFWDVPGDLVRQLRDAGIIVIYQVGSVPEAVAARRAGAEAIIAQGCEAGGHVRGDLPLSELLPEVTAAVDCPVLAAGGIVDGSDLATAIAMGADGAVLGTALLATHESFAHDYHKARLVAADGTDTVLTNAFHINWPRGAKMRVLVNSVTRGERGDPFGSETNVIGDENGRPIYLFSTDSPSRSMQGDFEAMALYAGTGVSRVTDIVGAGDRLHMIVAEAVACMEAGIGRPSMESISASPACYARDMDDAYMGFLVRDELVEALNELLEAERAAVRVCWRTSAVVAGPDLGSLLREIQLDGARWCAVLTQAVEALEASASRQTGAFYSEAMAISHLPQRMAALNRSQRLMQGHLQHLLPRVRDDLIHRALSSMLAAQERNMDRVQQWLRLQHVSCASP